MRACVAASTDRRRRTIIPGMRGDDREPDSMFSYVSPEQRIPKDHPLRAIRTLVDGVLGDMSTSQTAAETRMTMETCLYFAARSPVRPLNRPIATRA
jgi:hypothetical protein